ncbi:MAG: tRNA 2-thiouridine(34) synthase MnmA [Desulfamplus sp.]|nr:tRNA 2-thiouridine(34) synthase MnmA [Desulfamplus sp.]
MTENKDNIALTSNDAKRNNRIKRSVVKKVAVALSGGVDSLVTAFLLKKEYPNLFGIHFTTGYEEKIHSNEYLKEETLSLKTSSNHIVEYLKKQLDIPIYCVDLKEQFEKEVVSYFIETYKIGKTPNPCIVCNKKIKFGILLKAAGELGADFLATGHYARIGFNNQNSNLNDSVSLLRGKDSLKDQSYFLSMLSPWQLKQAIFPLGDFTKHEVVNIAAQNRITPIHKKESQDICFIHEDSFANFILSKCTNSLYQDNNKEFRPENIPFTSGDIVTTNGNIVGRHRGLYSYTIGQRRGLNCPGPAPYYVKKINIEQNSLIVGFKEELFEKECTVNHINWLSNEPYLADSSLRVTTCIRYSHKPVLSTLILNNAESTTKVIFDEPQLSVTPGQCAVFYDGDRVLGAGFIQ